MTSSIINTDHCVTTRVCCCLAGSYYPTRNKHCHNRAAQDLVLLLQLAIAFTQLHRLRGGHAGTDPVFDVGLGPATAADTTRKSRNSWRSSRSVPIACG